MPDSPATLAATVRMWLHGSAKQPNSSAGSALSELQSRLEHAEQALELFELQSRLEHAEQALEDARSLSEIMGFQTDPMVYIDLLRRINRVARAALADTDTKTDG